MSKTAVVYSTNTHPVYQHLSLLSIESLRYHSPTIPILLCHYGPLNQKLRKKFEALNVIIHDKKLMQGSISYGLKWYSLVQAKDYDRVLSVDSDTVFLDPVEDLLAQADKFDFYAREETATRSDVNRGGQIIPKLVIDDKMQALRVRLGSQDMPVFNSSVMLFNRSYHRQVIQRLPLFHELFCDFADNRLEYPATNAFVTEEVTGSLILGLPPAPTYGFWTENQVTHLNNWSAYDTPPFGTMMHVGHGHILQWMKFFGLEAEFKEMDKIYRLHYHEKDLLIHPLKGVLEGLLE